MAFYYWIQSSLGTITDHMARFLWRHSRGGEPYLLEGPASESPLEPDRLFSDIGE
jgi:hypothetical protein